MIIGPRIDPKTLGKFSDYPICAKGARGIGLGIVSSYGTVAGI
jgi:hypothetical protein